MRPALGDSVTTVSAATTMEFSAVTMEGPPFRPRPDDLEEGAFLDSAGLTAALEGAASTAFSVLAGLRSPLPREALVSFLSVLSNSGRKSSAFFFPLRLWVGATGFSSVNSSFLRRRPLTGSSKGERISGVARMSREPMRKSPLLWPPLVRGALPRLARSGWEADFFLFLLGSLIVIVYPYSFLYFLPVRESAASWGVARATDGHGLGNPWHNESTVPRRGTGYVL